MKRKSELLVWLDTAIGTRNLGDEIISQAVECVIRRLLPHLRVVRISPRTIGWREFRLMRRSSITVVGGTNILSSDPVFGYRQFGGCLWNWLFPGRVILLGVGWWQYQRPPGTVNAVFYRAMLGTGDRVHSVRDEYTKRYLNGMGIPAINTGCPTLWELRPFSYNASEQRRRVVVTLTDYKPRGEVDRSMLGAVCETCDEVFFWPQGFGDLQYLASLGDASTLRRIKVLAPTLHALDGLLDSGASYIGTRLHGGIRALQRGRMSYIIPVDNRATEMGADFGLPILKEPITARVWEGDYRFVGRVPLDAIRSFERNLRSFAGTAT